MAATLTDRRFKDSAWTFEQKLDGIRVLAEAPRRERVAKRRDLAEGRVAQDHMTADTVERIATDEVSRARPLSRS